MMMVHACFYLCVCANNKIECVSKIFSSTVAREVIVKNGGSLSHHHGFGKLRAPMLLSSSSSNMASTNVNVLEEEQKKNDNHDKNSKEIVSFPSSTTIVNDVMLNTKNTMDPHDVFDARNGMHFE